MCYAGGPYCDGTSRKRLTTALKAFKEDPQNAEKKKDYLTKREEYEGTPEGQSVLAKQIQKEKDYDRKRALIQRRGEALWKHKRNLKAAKQREAGQKKAVEGAKIALERREAKRQEEIKQDGGATKEQFFNAYKALKEDPQNAEKKKDYLAKREAFEGTPEGQSVLAKQIQTEKDYGRKRALMQRRGEALLKHKRKLKAAKQREAGQKKAVEGARIAFEKREAKRAAELKKNESAVNRLRFYAW